MYYGMNPQAYLAQTGYANMTGMTTQINPYQIPNGSSYMQPMFVDMNAYRGFSGIPTYPSFIGGTAMMNPQIPIAQPGQYYPQQSYMPQQMNYMQPQMGYMQQQQPMFGQSPFMSNTVNNYFSNTGSQSQITNIINNYFGGQQQPQQPQQQPQMPGQLQNMFMQVMMQGLMACMANFIGSNNQNSTTDVDNTIDNNSNQTGITNVINNIIINSLLYA